MLEITFKDGPAAGMTVAYKEPSTHLFVRRISRIQDHQPFECRECKGHCLHSLSRWSFAAMAWPDECVDEQAGIRAVIDAWPTDFPAHVYELVAAGDILHYAYVEECRNPRDRYSHGRHCTCRPCHDARDARIESTIDEMVALAVDLGEGGRIPTVTQLADRWLLSEESAQSVHNLLELGGVITEEGIVLPQTFWRGTVCPAGGPWELRRWATEEDVATAADTRRGEWQEGGHWWMFYYQIRSAAEAVGSRMIREYR